MFIWGTGETHPRNHQVQVHSNLKEEDAISAGAAFQQLDLRITTDQDLVLVQQSYRTVHMGRSETGSTGE